MGPHRWDDDDRLLEDLGAALRGVAPASEAMLAAGDAAFAWRTVDAELAALSYDSNLDGELLMRGGAVDARLPSRSLVFEGRALSVDIEISPETLHGQLLPAVVGEVVVVTAAGEAGRAVVDDLGRFRLPAPPPGLIRLRCETPTGTLVTGWVRI